MKMRTLLAAVFLCCATGSASAATIMLDIDSTQNGTSITTQQGFTSYNAGSGAAGSPPEGSVVIDGVTLTFFGGLDGSRHRATGGGGDYDALLRDFMFNDIESIDRQKEGRSPGSKVLLGVAVGAASFFTFLAIAFANWD